MAKVMVSMPDDILERLDAAAEKAGKSRSELLRDALRLYLASGATIDRAEVIARLRARVGSAPRDESPEALVRRERNR